MTSMHEVSLVHALFDEADRSLGAHPRAAVRVITARIGAQSGVEPTLFRTAFDGCRAERGYGASALVIEVEPAAWRCEDCGAAVRDDGPLRCAACGGAAEMTAGDALVLQRMELEVRDV